MMNHALWGTKHKHISSIDNALKAKAIEIHTFAILFVSINPSTTSSPTIVTFMDTIYVVTNNEKSIHIDAIIFAFVWNCESIEFGQPSIEVRYSCHFGGNFLMTTTSAIPPEGPLPLVNSLQSSLTLSIINLRI